MTEEAIKSAGYTNYADLYLGHYIQYWEDLVIGWLPMLLFLIIYILGTILYFKIYKNAVAKSELVAERRQKDAVARSEVLLKSQQTAYDSAMERHLKTMELMETTNKLLAEISQKLDKK